MQDVTSDNTTGSVQHATCNRRLAPHHMQRDEMRRETGNRQRTPCERGHRGWQQKTDNVQQTHATCTGGNATDNTPRVTHNIETTCAMQRAICSEQQRRATCKAACNAQHATDHRQRGKDNRRRATDNTQQGNKATRQHAECSTHRAEDGKQQATHATDNVHRTTDGMQEDASTREMHQEPHGTAAFRARRAAGSRPDQHARSIVLDNQCATRHGRHTQDATYDPCRSMQQTHMNIHGVRRKQSRGSRTSGLFCPARWLRWTLGGGLTARLVRRLRAPLASCSRRLRRADSRSFACRFTLLRFGDSLTFR